MKMINLAPVTASGRRIFAVRQIGAIASAWVAIACLDVATVPAFATDKPPLRLDEMAPSTAPSTISATVQFSLRALDRALERKIPRRLATFNDRMTSCWHRRFLGRQINIDCVYSGYVERTGPISLRAEGGRLSATTPLLGAVSGQGTRRLAGLLHGSAEGRMTLYASSRPRLRPDWSVALDMSEGFRWTEPPILTILGFRINLARYVEPRIRSQLGRVAADAAASVRELDVRGKAETAWRHAFAAVKIVDTPEIWLRTTPQSVAFSGVRAEGDVLEGSIEIAGTTETFFGTEPAAPAPTPLPRLGNDVADPGRFEIIVPVNISYDLIRQKIQDFLAVRAVSGGPTLREVAIYPSAGKIVAGLRIASPGAGAESSSWIYITATPRIDADTQAVQFSDLAFTTDAATPAPSSPAPPFSAETLQMLRQQLQIGYEAELKKLMASASARLTRPLGNGFRSEGRLTSAGLDKILLLADGLSVRFRARGDLKILYGL